jgi:hypothetical protein
MPWSRAKALPPPDNSLFDACFRIQREAIEAAGHHIPLVVENVRGAQKWVGRARWNFGSFYLWGDVPALMPIHAIRAHKIANSDLHLGDPRSPEGSPARLRYEARRKLPRGRSFDGSIKCGGDWFNASQPSISRMTSSKSPARKAASALIAKIPLPLSRHVARTFHPRTDQRAAA